jgi:glycosyltransferase involved in cell wall biosynthesis
VKPNDPQALAEGLARLVGDSKLREELGRRGREAVHRDFGDARMAEQTLEVFRRFLTNQ